MPSSLWNVKRQPGSHGGGCVPAAWVALASWIIGSLTGTMPSTVLSFSMYSFTLPGQPITALLPTMSPVAENPIATYPLLFAATDIVTVPFTIVHDSVTPFAASTTTSFCAAQTATATTTTTTTSAAFMLLLPNYGSSAPPKRTQRSLCVESAAADRYMQG